VWRISRWSPSGAEARSASPAQRQGLRLFQKRKADEAEAKKFARQAKQLDKQRLNCFVMCTYSPSLAATWRLKV
jgi:hypothetical protein